MRSQKIFWRQTLGWSLEADGDCECENTLVLVFGARAILEQADVFETLKHRYPNAVILGCSTGGQIEIDRVEESGAQALVIKFDKTRLDSAAVRIEKTEESFDVGRRLGEALAGPDLKAAFILSDGLHVNGAQLVRGARQALGDHVVITGGLAGDGADFRRTLVHGCGTSEEKRIAAVGFYGSSLRVGASSAAGWSPFGPRRTITRSEGPVLYELDGQNALEIYKSYLGEEAAGLPGTGLLYPLAIHDPDNPSGKIIRTILAVDEAKSSMTFAGDTPLGWRAQLMRGDFDALSQAAFEAASAALAPLRDAPGPKTAVLISCIGRKIVMGENTIEEIVAARRAFGKDDVAVGFYSYGEIAPHPSSGCSELHNQTMTVTVFAEV